MSSVFFSASKSASVERVIPPVAATSSPATSVVAKVLEENQCSEEGASLLGRVATLEEEEESLEISYEEMNFAPETFAKEKKPKGDGKKLPIEGSDGKTYYAHHDGHGYKHLADSKAALARYQAKPRQFIGATKTGEAKFFPDYCGTKSDYDQLVTWCVECWAKREVKGKEPYIVEMRGPVGADKGDETSLIQIYGMTSLGAHVRPKSAKYLKSI